MNLKGQNLMVECEQNLSKEHLLMNTVSKISLGDMQAIFPVNEEGRAGFLLIPSVDLDASDKDIHLEKGWITPMVQLSVTGDSSDIGFAAGETRHNSGLTMSMKYAGQEVLEETVDGNKETKQKFLKTIITKFVNENGIRAEQILTHVSDSKSVSVQTKVTNDGDEDIMLEALSSFCLTGITPYSEDAGRDRLFLHKIRSRWSAEGRHEERPIEDMLLEPSWARFGERIDKFGVIGSMPVRGYFPFEAIEDREAGVFWAATNACSSSWQFENIIVDENFTLSGGLADYEFGHWRKKLKKGESFTSPSSYLTVVRGSFDDACDRLLDEQRVRLTDNQKQYLNAPAKELPALFNEFCTTWGEPSEAKIKDILKVINGEHFDYLVIDAGWYRDSVRGWQDNMGEWTESKELFPNGLKEVVRLINEAGMKAGIWFELEVVGKDSVYIEDTPHLLTRDGKVIVSGTRRFWDMRSEWVEEHLTCRVIDFLRDNGFEYIKIDYNDTIGIGCDGADSPGEGLRQCVEATKKFYRKIRECVPGIAIEVCSSGGHRLEPGFMETADFLSFSDAHEQPEIPVIALDLQRLILPSKSQIWAVLRKEDSLKRITYSVCAGMYGVLCISGDVFDLSKEQWDHAIRGVEFYREVSPVIADGRTKRFGPFQKSNRALKDYQASVRYGRGDADGLALVLLHTFKNDSGERKIDIPLEDNYIIKKIYEADDHGVKICGNSVTIKFKEDYDAVAVLLMKEEC